MDQGIPLFPPQASTSAASVDALFFYLLAMGVIGTILVGGIMGFFAIRYRAGAQVDRSNPKHHSTALELTWSAIPLAAFLIAFFWGAAVYFNLYRVPDEAMEIQVLGKRWMWKLQHSNGRREINELHVPVNTPVRLNLASEDVIHSFYVPAFRIKRDVVPGRYTTAWFTATRTGRYHLLCAEYCGTKHSQMVGSVTVLDPDEFQAWLGGEAPGLSPAAAGERLFQAMGCVTCHSPDSRARGPNLAGLPGSTVRFEGGGSTEADAAYIRESILNPRARIRAGYEALMPTYQGLISEEGVLQLIEYIRTLGPEQPSGTASAGETERGESS